jgi:thiol-disulfide isomerase/thioredoxin
MKNLFVLFLFVSLSVVAPPAFTQTQAADPSKQQPVLTELPDTVLNTELQLLGGNTLKLSEYSGKVVVINLFATWCGPCRFESPDLAKLYKEFKDRDVLVIELSTGDPAVTEESLRDWVSEFRLPYRVGWVPGKIALTLMQGHASIPQAFVVAPDGRIVRRFIGYNPKMTLNQMREAVEEALK